MTKLGRPKKKGGSDADKRLRRQWRKASAKYYKKNQKKILKKATSRKRGKK